MVYLREICPNLLRLGNVSRYVQSDCGKDFRVERPKGSNMLVGPASVVVFGNRQLWAEALFHLSFAPCKLQGLRPKTSLRRSQLANPANPRVNVKAKKDERFFLYLIFCLTLGANLRVMFSLVCSCEVPIAPL